MIFSLAIAVESISAGQRFSISANTKNAGFQAYSAALFLCVESFRDFTDNCELTTFY
jgi:hypothetical protein